MAKTIPRLSAEQIQHAIQVAWDDKPPYHRVLLQCGLSPGQMLQLLKRELTPNAFRLWKARSQGKPGPARGARGLR